MHEDREREQRIELAVWSALRGLDEQFGLLPSIGVSNLPRREEIGEYLDSRKGLHQPIGILRAAIELALPESRVTPEQSWARQVFAAVLIQYDERERSHMNGVLQTEGVPLLQTEHAQLYDGGDYFYSLLERALRSRTTPPLVLQLFLFCLKSGFLGRYDDCNDPERLGYLRDLMERVSPARPSVREIVPVIHETNRIDGKGFPFWNYAIAVSIVLCVWTALKVGAYVHEAKQVGITTCVDP